MAKEAKTSPVKYVEQVRQEFRKVTWPTGRETFVTTILVMVMVFLMGLFFMLVDWFWVKIIKFIIGFGGAS